MRSSKSRSRSKTNRPRTLGNIINRVFDSSGPEGKVRGTPQQIIEKYQFLARDAQLSNDRVAAENFMQHAEHYTRMLGEATREMAAEQEQRQQQNGQYGNGGQNNQNNQNNQNGFGQQRERPYQEREFRPERGDYRAERGEGEGSATNVMIAGEESGLVDLPEAPRSAPQPRREEYRRDDKPREQRSFERPREEGQRPAAPRPQQPPHTPRPPQPARDEAPRPPRAAPASTEEMATLPDFVTTPRPKPAPAKPPAATEGEAAEAAPKPRRAPRKPAVKEEAAKAEEPGTEE